MKKNFIGKVALAFSAVILMASVSCKKSTVINEACDDDVVNTLALRQQLQSSVLTTLDQRETESLLYMREEEKMARDVYITLGKKWSVRVFDNISTAEQIHMNAVLLLLNKYSIQDPVGTNETGVFTNRKLQVLYNQLIQKGNLSLAESYKAGAAIEDLDIYDLKTALTFVTSADVNLVYGNLKRASENHLRAFYKNLVRVGSMYTPQYLTQSEFDAIISG